MQSFFKKFTLFLLALLILTAVGCGKKNNNNNQNGENDTPPVTEGEGEGEQEQEEDPPEEETRIEGTVTEITVSDSETSGFIVRTQDKKDYEISMSSDFVGKPSLGDTVSLTVEGDISQTAPYQATASRLDITKEFAGVPQTVSVYRVADITSEQLDGSLDSSGWTFEKFTDYNECQDYIDQNGLGEKFNSTVGDTDMTTLTEEFFTGNNLYIFITARNSADEPAANEVSLMDNVLYLKVSETSTEVTVNNQAYKAYLVPLSKETEISDGVLLYQRTLNGNLGDGEDSNGDMPPEAGSENQTEGGQPSDGEQSSQETEENAP